MVVFGSQSARDTEKQATETIKTNMREGEALYLYVDTDKLDPNSDLGRVARRNDQGGLGLGSTGKSDLVFTGVYAVQQNQDGSLGLGNSVATFWGGRSEISTIMREQLQYAKRATLNLGGGGDRPPAPPGPPSDNVPGPVRPGADVPPPQPGQRPDAPPPGPRPQPERRPDQTPPPGNDRRPDQPPPGGGRDREDAEARQRNNQREQEALRQQVRRQRMQELARVGGDKGYTLEQYADGWGRFLERAEVQQGPTHTALNELGRQTILGEFDGRRLGEMLNQIPATTQAEMDQALTNINEQLQTNGLKINIAIDASTGRATSIEMTELANRPEDARTSVRINASGEVVSTEGTAAERRPLAVADASLRLAKKAEPAACP